MKHLRLLRIVIGLVVFLCMNVTIVTGIAATPRVYSALERMQIVPAVLTFSVSAIVFWIAVTLLLGRVYCSVFCPLGISMDGIAHVLRANTKWRMVKPYHYVGPNDILRFSILAIFVISIIAGITTFILLLDPTALYKCFTGEILYSLFHGDVPLKILGGTTIGSIMLIVLILIMAAMRGRRYCNTVCPVGTMLSLVARYSIMTIDINTDRCTHCGKCEQVCKSQCINLRDRTVDIDRCVVCFNCINVCDDDAITYTSTRHRLSDPLMQRSTPEASTSMNKS